MDVTIQAQILDLLRQLQSDLGMSILIITHDLGIVAEMADEVAVMYASKVVERPPVKELFARPLHPYTVGLFQSRPEPGKPKNQRLNTIPGMVPSPLHFPAGCKFHTRCPFRRSLAARPRSRSCGRFRPAILPAAISPASWISCATKTNGELPTKTQALSECRNEPEQWAQPMRICNSGGRHSESACYNKRDGEPYAPTAR